MTIDIVDKTACLIFIPQHVQCLMGSCVVFNFEVSESPHDKNG